MNTNHPAPARDGLLLTLMVIAGVDALALWTYRTFRRAPAAATA